MGRQRSVVRGHLRPREPQEQEQGALRYPGLPRTPTGATLGCPGQDPGRQVRLLAQPGSKAPFVVVLVISPGAGGDGAGGTAKGQICAAPSQLCPVVAQPPLKGFRHLRETSLAAGGRSTYQEAGNKAVGVTREECCGIREGTGRSGRTGKCR